jgi:transketolase
MKRVGIMDRFGESGKPDELLQKFGLTYADVVESVKHVLELKK